uniref:Uncharacterized protein n=1 Tax=Fagus sylvatica TaxID=28930 RepID=A0A2N9IDX9_FAGSY
MLASIQYLGGPLLLLLILEGSRSIARVGTVAVEKKAFDITQLSRLYEGPGVRAVYMAERVTHQLGNGEDLVLVAPLQFTLFPYEAPNKIVNLWTSGVCYLEQLVEDGDFEEYQQSLMPALYPPYEAHVNIPAGGGHRVANPDGLHDIVLPPGRFLYTVLMVPSPRQSFAPSKTTSSLSYSSVSVETLQDDFFVKYVAPFIVENELACASFEWRTPLHFRRAPHPMRRMPLRNMNSMMMDYSREHFSRPPGSSSKGAQADLDATDFDDDDDDESTFQR